MANIDINMSQELPLTAIDRVVFYKRDELTTDLICCDVDVGPTRWFFHEEMTGWEPLLDHLTKLKEFDGHWFAKVSQPPFASSDVVAFERKV